MTHREDVTRSRDIFARWQTLAEQRLDYLTVLFETGRWRRYHSEQAFLENIQEAKTAVEIWRDLATREASRDNSAVDTSWLGRGAAVRPRAVVSHDHAPLFVAQPKPLPIEPQRSDVSHQAPPAPEPATPLLETTPAPVLDLTTIQQRYPLLHNAL